MIFFFDQSKTPTKRGFTLVELLVVIAIIGLLSTITTVAIRGIRIRARDVRRLHDVRQIRTALELYASQQPTRAYPISAGMQIGVVNQSDCLSGQPPGFVAKPCANAVLPIVQGDPTSGTYYYESINGFTYSLVGTLEGTVEGMSGTLTATENGF